MKKLLIGLGIVFLCLLILGIIGILISANSGSKLDKSSKAYVDEVAPIILTSWNTQELLNRASPELLKFVPIDKLNTLFNMLSEKLGRLKEYKGSEGEAKINIIFPGGRTVRAEYIVRAVFEKGDAEVMVTLIQHNNKWRIQGFHVSSEALMPH